MIKGIFSYVVALMKCIQCLEGEKMNYTNIFAVLDLSLSLWNQYSIIITQNTK